MKHITKKQRAMLDMLTGQLCEEKENGKPTAETVERINEVINQKSIQKKNETAKNYRRAI